MLEEILFHHLSLTNEELADGYTLVIEDICLDRSEMKTREEELVSSCCNITYIESNINMNTHVLDIVIFVIKNVTLVFHQNKELQKYSQSNVKPRDRPSS